MSPVFFLQLLVTATVLTFTWVETAPLNDGTDESPGSLIVDDMILTAEQLTAIKEGEKQGESDKQRRVATKSPRFKRWPGGVVPYEYDTHVNFTHTPQEKGVIQSAMSEWTNHTCLVFRLANSSDPNRILFTKRSGCWSYISMTGGTQLLSLGVGCLYTVNVAVHEIGHAVGFFHEHNRPDRDDYITIHTENITNFGLRAFRKLSSDLVNLYGTPYDFKSIMHYGSHYFSKNGNATITAKNPNQTITEGLVLSTSDIKVTKLMYSCADLTSSASFSQKRTEQKRKSSCRNRPVKEDSKRKRKKFVCPVDGCKGATQNIKKHMRQVHKDIPEQEYNLGEKRKDIQRQKFMWKCQEKDCTWVGDRLDKHLQGKAHGFTLHQATNTARKYRANQLPKSVPQKRSGKDLVNCDTLSQEFFNWFTSIEGGNYIPEYLSAHKKKERLEQNKKVANMIKTVLTVSLGEKDFQVSELSELVNIGKSNSVITKLAETRTWGTVRNYLHALSHFLRFVEACYPSALSQATLNIIKANLKGCIHTVVKLTQEQNQKRKLADRKRLLIWPDLCNYVDADLAQTYMEKFKKRPKKDVAEKVAKHLLLKIAAENGKRTGVYADITVRHFEEAEEEGEGFVILVDEGKTFRASGGAGVFLSPEEHHLVAEFLAKCRPLFSPETDQIFCRSSGKRSSVRNIQEYLREAWDEYGKNRDVDLGQITCTLLRKTLVTMSRKKGLDRREQEEMALHMNHHLNTADRHYDVNTGQRITAKFRQIIRKFDERASSESEDSASEVSCDDQIMSDESFDNEYLPLASLEEKSVAVGSLHSDHQGTTEVGLKALKFGRELVFSGDDAQRLSLCCARVIQFGKTKQGIVTKKMIVDTVKSAGPNFVDLLLNYSENQLCTKIRTEIRKK